MYLRLLDYDLKVFDEYQHSVAGSFSSTLKAIKRRGEALPSGRQDDFYDIMYDEIALTRDDFPHILHSTMLVTLYSMFECQLRSLCRILAKRSGTKKNPKGPGKGSIQFGRLVRNWPGSSP